MDVREGEVHQHRLAAPDAAPEIDASGTVGPVAEPFTQEPALNEARSEPVERGDRTLLRGIGLELACAKEPGIGPPDGAAHAGALRSRMRFSVPLKL